MKPAALMVLGALTGIVLCIGSIFLDLAPTAIVCVFGAGAIFGKGYGVWETKSALSSTAGREG